MKIIVILIAISIQISAIANQSPTSRENGIKDERHATYALINAHIFLDSQTELDNATLIIRDNKILAVGSNVTVPDNAISYDMAGSNIYPGFILLDSDYGLSKVKPRTAFRYNSKETLDSTTTGVVNSNEAIKASYQAISDFHHDAEKAKKLREIGFSTVLSSKHDGIMRGTSVLVSLNDKPDQQSIVTPEVAFHLSFDKGSSKQLYPISLMGATALMRQTWLDADWYSNGIDGYTDLDLQAVNAKQSLLQIFEVKNWQQTLLANKIAKEFDKDIVIKSSGDEYKHIDAIKKLNKIIITPLNFPKAMDVADELDAWNVSLEKMMEWESAPYNPYFLYSNEIEFAITANLNEQKTFLKDLRKAIKKGLPKSAALASLTTTPAKILANKSLGHLHKGASANFIVAHGDVFSSDGIITENWVAGQRYIVKKLPRINPGIYQLQFDKQTKTIEITLEKGKLKLKDPDKESKTKYKAQIDNGFVVLEIKQDKQVKELSGLLVNNIMRSIKGQSPSWTLQRVSDSVKDEKKDKKGNDKSPIPKLIQPFSAYGMHEVSDSQSYLIKNATVWTNEKDGVLEQTDVLVKNGKINQIGKNLNSKTVTTIDATNMHLTAGIIDEHSHIALLSVNDLAVNSSMVRMEDALDSDDIDIYRNLSGGVTATQLLHGSANPIGGQSALIKMRWGATSEELLIKDADKFIKFALGENVKRSSSQASIRYPQTRMGVEQIYQDAFSNALVYEKKWQNYNKSRKKGAAPRRDLMMEATLEIINKQRFVTSHSYVQSEINMLMKVAENFNFTINTFTHILEGYKVADKMLAHGVGASTFADWWAYKWEVNFAIPYNAAILTKVGVTTAINSDDAEMSRRLNQEAAKSIKYGGLTEQQALKLVTLNPAKLLHLDDRMGSIKVGKDADIVLWTANPMTIYATVNKTFVDGRLLFDRDKQLEIEQGITEERARLIKKINEADEDKLPAMMKPNKHMQCDSITGYEYFIGALQ